MALPLMAQTAQTQSQIQGGSELTGGPADNSKRMTLAMFSINRRLTALINVSKSSGEFLKSIDSSSKDTKNKTTEALEQSGKATEQMSSGLGKIFDIFNWFKRKTQAERDQAKVEKAQKVEEAREARRARRKEWIKGIGSKVTGRVDSAVKKAGSGIWNLLKKAAWGVALIGLITFLRSPHWPKVQKWLKDVNWTKVFESIGNGIEKVAGFFMSVYDYLFGTADDDGKEIEGLFSRMGDTIESFKDGGLWKGIKSLFDNFSALEAAIAAIAVAAPFLAVIGAPFLAKLALAALAITGLISLVNWLIDNDKDREKRQAEERKKRQEGLKAEAEALALAAIPEANKKLTDSGFTETEVSDLGMGDDPTAKDLSKRLTGVDYSEVIGGHLGSYGQSEHGKQIVVTMGKNLLEIDKRRAKQIAEQVDMNRAEPALDFFGDDPGEGEKLGGQAFDVWFQLLGDKIADSIGGVFNSGATTIRETVEDTKENIKESGRKNILDQEAANADKRIRRGGKRPYGWMAEDDIEFEVPEIKPREIAAQTLNVASMNLSSGSATEGGTSVNAATDARQISTINNASYQSIGTSAEPRYWGSQAWGGHRRNWGQGRVDIW